MKQNLKKMLDIWMKVAVFMGNTMTAVIMTAFYFTVFALFAIPYRIFGRPFQAKAPNSNWAKKKKNLEIINDFRSE